MQHLRSARNMTQEQLAMLIGVSRQSVTKWEAARAYPEMDKLIKICDIFGCSLDDLVTGDLTDAVPSPGEILEDAPATDICGYDTHMRSFAVRIGAGTSCFILGAALSILLSAIFAEDAVPPIGLLIGILAGLALVVPAAMEHSLFQREHPFITDFYTPADRARSAKRLAYVLILGIGLILVVTMCADLCSQFLAENFVGAIELTGIGCGAGMLTWAGIMHNRLNIESYNRSVAEDLDRKEIEKIYGTDSSEAVLYRARMNQLAGMLCGAIMIVATIIGLCLLFLPVPPAISSRFWLSWPIGGCLCGLVGTAIAYMKYRHS
nr:helix-turn-helix transcriptional regulator [Collinsella urealyticum]